MTTTLRRWAPSTFDWMEEEFHEMMERMDRVFGRTTPAAMEFAWRPRIDLDRLEDKLMLRVEVPGMDFEDFSIELEGNLLRVFGEKKLEHETEEAHRYVRECRYGSFRREIVVPEGIDPEAIIAKYEMGVLMVEIPLPKKELEMTTKKIPITS